MLKGGGKRGTGPHDKMTVKDLIKAERKEAEEEDKALDEIEAVKPADDEGVSPDDEMFCTAAGAANVRPQGRPSNFLRSLFKEVDRA